MAENSDAAMLILQEGDVRFVIVDRTTTDMEEKQFIKRLRDAQPPYYIYILLIASKVQDTDITTPRGGADDYLHKPVVPLELKSRDISVYVCWGWEITLSARRVQWKRRPCLIPSRGR